MAIEKITDEQLISRIRGEITGALGLYGRYDLSAERTGNVVLL